ncbi:zinc finger translocation-associated protein isoform X1 [Tachysurus fulvidraco]|uniref:zinc finger translocation-associated protein isoform X1 n=1 Tax=Tachysurus fulvidraco TaxID=1234273 RepID=UPI000F4FA251|nr:zinc finger translocation-associated protein isoform X1 [Tachysurus fulvidraco]
MEEKESRESEPGVQTESLSLIISDEGEEASPPYSASAQRTADDDDMTNGHMRDETQAGLITHVDTPGTSYWSVSESPESPFLLSPVPGPSRHKTSPAKSGRASRTGHSRIPGRDHRRYYHEHWRTEYLMDFDPKRNGMICMVCGSSLATLKLSTIKRHIRQKHPDSLLWSASDKEVIRSGWENHLNLETSQTSCPDSAIASEPEETLECASLSTDKPGSAVLVKTESQSEPSMVSFSSTQETQSVSAEMLERYVNDSLHAWFRQEFLMEYQAEAGRLVCMVCSCPLPSLHLDHIKRHVLGQHPNSLVYSAEEKHRVLQSWAQSQDSSRDYVKSEPETKDLSTNSPVPFPSTEPDSLQHSTEPYRGSTRESDAPPQIATNSRVKNSCPWHLRLDYLVAIGPPSMPGCFCMVCSDELPVVRVSSFRRHIQDCHPETSNLSQREREDIASAWTQDGAAEEPETHAQHASPSNTLLESKPLSIKPSPRHSGIQKEEGERSKIMSAPIIGRHSHYPGKDQRRNYQVRWRMEYLMDYDCRRHGLICMVCGATLATLKVSTIKRHIQQVHPHSLNYSTEEKQQAVQSYSQATLNFIHSDNCFSGSDHSHGVQTNTNANAELDQV